MVLWAENRLFSDIEGCLHSLMLKSEFFKDVGLFDGKTGVAIVYAEVAKFLSNEVYYDCMSDMLDDVLIRLFFASYASDRHFFTIVYRRFF